MASSKTTQWSMRALSQLPSSALSQESAKQLLRDTSFRLQSQALLVQQISDSLLLSDREKDRSSDKRSNPSSSTSSSSSTNSSTTSSSSSTSSNKHGIIIKASSQSSMQGYSNHLLDWKGHLERQAIEQRTMHQAEKALRNLQVLHSDTLQLTQQLLDSDRIWNNFTSSSTNSITNNNNNSTANQAVIAASMEQIRSRHATTLETMADLVLLLRSSSHYYYDLLPQDALTSFLRGRLGVQLLCDHYVGWSKGKVHGAVSVDCSLEPILEESKTEALHLCDAHYQVHPEIILLTPDYPSLTLIRPWLHHALVEVLKNAMVASMERMEEEAAAAGDNTSTTTPPPIEIELVQENDDFISILIRDHGHGLPVSSSSSLSLTEDHTSSPDNNNNTMKTFLFASSTDKWDRLDVQQSYATVRSPLSSLGVGLPSSQWLLQHFGGDLELTNNRDRGCTAVLRLPLTDDVLEYLPPANEKGGS